MVEWKLIIVGNMFISWRDNQAVLRRSHSPPAIHDQPEHLFKAGLRDKKLVINYGATGYPGDNGYTLSHNPGPHPPVYHEVLGIVWVMCASNHCKNSHTIVCF